MTVINISTFTSNIGSYYLSYYNNKLCLYNSNTYKFHDLNNNELLPFYINTSISPYGISGIMIDKDNNPVIIEFNPDPDMRMDQLWYHDSCLLDHQERVMKLVYGNV